MTEGRDLLMLIDVYCFERIENINDMRKNSKNCSSLSLLSALKWYGFLHIEILIFLLHSNSSFG